ncbi:hypothetical protein B0H10DRAFT_1955599 [Mycena sp. CBHHK59/15]|nr:hypothetical protein B0H10DRAFT_1955599 [Mycena sp. CBHHK59/15]
MSKNRRKNCRCDVGRSDFCGVTRRVPADVTKFSPYTKPTVFCVPPPPRISFPSGSSLASSSYAFYTSPASRVTQRKNMLPVVLFIWALCHIGSVYGYVPRADSASQTSSASTSIATPAFYFRNIVQMTTCTPGTVSWIYVGSLSEVTLSITNGNVVQLPSPSSTITGVFQTASARAINPHSRREAINQPITNGTIDPAADSYTWNVNVPAGWYAIVAQFPLLTVTQVSDAFYVANGIDTSCLASSSGSSSSTTSASSTRSVTPTSSDGTSSSGITLPVSGAATSKVNRGAIAGGVIGGLAVLAAAIAAYLYLRYASASVGAAPGKRGARKWSGLGSVDSKARAYPPSSRAVGGSNDRHHSQSDSIGPMISDSDYVIGNVGTGSKSNVDPEDEENNSYFSPSLEKFPSPTGGSPIRSPFSDSGHIGDAVPLDLITPLPGNVTRNSSTSTSSYMPNPNFSRPRSHPNSPYSSPTTPTPEYATSPSPNSPFTNSANNNTNSSLGHSGSYPPTPAYPSGTSQGIAEAQQNPDPPRRGSAGEPVATGSRRTPRKPVPQYNPTDPSLSSSSPYLATLDSESSSREGSVRSDRSGPGAHDWPKLSHKASFGTEGRPVHYLIPDMPPPQRN